MGNEVKNTKLLIIDEKGTVSALEWCEIKDITHHKDMPILYMNNKPVQLKPNICTETVISGERGYLYDIPTCMFESAKKTLDFIVADKRRQEIEEIENELKEMGTPNSARIRCGYAPIGWAIDEKTRELYERYKALKPELFEHHDGLVGIDKELINYAYPKRVFMSARCSGKTEMQRKWIKDNLHLFATDCPKFIFSTSKLPKLDPNDNSFIKRLEKSNIWINENKKVVTVKKPDGSVIKVKCDQRDEFDPYVGAALALAYKEFGSKSKFRKYVDELLAKQNKKDKK